MKNNFPSIKVKVKDLIPYARNSRTHSDKQVAEIAASIREFGFTNPVIIRRWQDFTGQKATMAGDAYEEVAARGINVQKAT